MQCLQVGADLSGRDARPGVVERLPNAGDERRVERRGGAVRQRGPIGIRAVIGFGGACSERRSIGNSLRVETMLGPRCEQGGGTPQALIALLMVVKDVDAQGKWMRRRGISH